MKIDLHNRRGEVVAIALIDDADVHLVAGKAWHLDASGYAVHTLPRVNGGNQSLERMHRLVVGLQVGDVRQADHINGDRLDNRRQNLRIVAAAENQQNVRPRGGTSPHRGVYRRPSGRWAAQVRSAGRLHIAGTFDTETEAAAAAAEARRRLLPLANEERSCA